MASAVYPLGKKALMNKEIDMDTDTIKVTGVADEDYTYNAAHEHRDDITEYSGIAGATIANITLTSNVVDGDDISPAFTSIAIDGAKDIDALIIYWNSGAAATDTLLVYIDLSTSITPNGGDINLTWDSGANKIFAL